MSVTLKVLFGATKEQILRQSLSKAEGSLMLLGVLCLFSGLDLVMSC